MLAPVHFPAGDLLALLWVGYSSISSGVGGEVLKEPQCPVECAGRRAANRATKRVAREA